MDFNSTIDYERAGICIDKTLKQITLKRWIVILIFWLPCNWDSSIDWHMLRHQLCNNNNNNNNNNNHHHHHHHYRRSPADRNSFHSQHIGSIHTEHHVCTKSAIADADAFHQHWRSDWSRYKSLWWCITLDIVDEIRPRIAAVKHIRLISNADTSRW